MVNFYYFFIYFTLCYTIYRNKYFEISLLIIFKAKLLCCYVLAADSISNIKMYFGPYHKNCVFHIILHYFYNKVKKFYNKVFYFNIEDELIQSICQIGYIFLLINFFIKILFLSKYIFDIYKNNVQNDR